MKRDDLLARLKTAEADLKARGVAHAALFGSVARGEDGLDSDIDVMVEIDPERHRSMDVYTYVGIVNLIGDLFSVPVDVSNRVAMKDDVRLSAEHDAVYAF